MRRTSIAIATFLGLPLLGFLCAIPAGAAIISTTFTGTGVNPDNPGITLAAEAVFAVDTADPDVLMITLSNTGAYDAIRRTDILTALFFSIEGDPDPVLETGAAILPAGNQIYKYVKPKGADPGGIEYLTVTDVGSEWAYADNLQDLPATETPGPWGATRGISAVGFGIFNKFGRFNTADNLSGPSALNGLDFGITSAGDDPATGNGGLDGQYLIRNTVQFTMENLPDGFDLDRIHNVHFQYGTSLDQPDVIPEPTGLIIWSLLGATGLGAFWWRKR